MHAYAASQQDLGSCIDVPGQDIGGLHLSWQRLCEKQLDGTHLHLNRLKAVIHRHGGETNARDFSIELLRLVRRGKLPLAAISSRNYGTGQGTLSAEWCVHACEQATWRSYKHTQMNQRPNSVDTMLPVRQSEQHSPIYTSERKMCCRGTEGCPGRAAAGKRSVAGISQRGGVRHNKACNSRRNVGAPINPRPEPIHAALLPHVR